MTKQVYPKGYWTEERVINESKNIPQGWSLNKAHQLHIKLHAN
jgi:hypothetical protein